MAGAHALRTSGLGLGFFAVAAVFWRNGLSTWMWLLLVCDGFGWPHLARAQACPPSVSLLMLDIDHFKSINDRHGHTAGDEAIGRIGAIIRTCLREGDIAGRYGGNEFGVVLNVDAAITARVAERIRSGVHAAVFEHTPALRCTPSIGIAQLDDETRDARKWIRQADAALYGAKLRGRNHAVSAVLGELDGSAA